MATYTHACKDCGHRFESVRPMSQSDKKPRCPDCKSRNTKKLINDVPFVKYIGDGFTKSNNN